jgi:large conductance mechanosensitive channel
MGMLQEFKEFAMKGNLIDTAVAFVMGVAFGKVSSTFIDGMFMPLVGLIFNVGDMSSMKVTLKAAEFGADGKLVTAANEFMYGKKAEPAPAPAGPTATEALLAEIRDSLKK